MKNLKNVYLLTLLISTLSASGFTTNTISPGNTLVISSNAIPVGSLINGAELYIASTNHLLKAQNGYYQDYDFYVITNNAIVLDNWYIQMDITSLPPVYHVGQADSEDNPIVLDSPLATFSMDKISLLDNGFNMELDPNWSSTNLTFYDATNRFFTYLNPPMFSDNLYFNDFDENGETQSEYNPITIPARGSSVEFGLFSEPGVSNYNHEMEVEFNFFDATTQGVENWKDEFEITIQLESVGGDDFGGVNEQIVRTYFNYNSEDYDGINYWYQGGITHQQLGLSLASLSSADFKFYSSNGWYYVDFLPVGMSNQTDFINLMSWGSTAVTNGSTLRMLTGSFDPYFSGMGGGGGSVSATNTVDGYNYVDISLPEFPENFSYYGLGIEAMNSEDTIESNSLGVNYFNVSRNPSMPLDLTNDDGISISFPEGYYIGSDVLFSDNNILIAPDDNLVMEGAHGSIFRSGLDFLSTNESNQVTSGALAAGSLIAIDNVLGNILNDFSSNNSYSNLNLLAGDTIYQDGLLVKEAAIDYIYGNNSFTGSLVAVLSATNVTLFESWASEDVSTSTLDALFSAVSSPSATPSVYVNRLPEPTSLSAVSLDWELELSSLPNYPTNGSLEVGMGFIPFNDSVDFYPLEDEKLFCTYPYQGVSNERDYGYSQSNLTTVITVISPDGSVAYSDTDSYVPFIASGMSKEIISILPKNLGNGMFMIHRNFEGQGGEELGYTNVYHTTSALYYPTNGTYEKIYFDGMETKIYDNEGMNLSESDLRNSWQVHQNKIYFKSNNSTQLRKYSINLPHLNVIDVSDPSAALLALDARLDSVETNLTQVSSNVAISNSALNGAFAASDASVSNAVISYADSAINAFSNSVDWASIGGGSSDPALESRVSSVESINTLLANSINLEVANREADVEVLQQEIDDLEIMLSSVTNNTAGITISEAKQMMKDLRPGSTIIDVDNGTATISMHLEESSDLTTNWTQRAEAMEISVPATNGVQFFRFGN